MLRKLTLALLALMLLASARADDEKPAFDPERMTSDELLIIASRYGNTQEKRDQKKAAREILFARRSDGFRAVMAQAHLENVGVQVLAQEFVDLLPASNSVPVLLDTLKTTPTNTHKIATYFLGFNKTPEHADVITPFLADERLRGVTIRTLGKWGITSAVPAITGFLTSTNERIRVASVNALRDIGDPAALPALIEALGDPVFTVRNTAQRAVVSFGKAAEKPLVAALPDAVSPAQRLIIQSLGQIKSTQTAKSLKPFLKHPDPLVRQDAENAIADSKNAKRSWF